MKEDKCNQVENADDEKFKSKLTPLGAALGAGRQYKRPMLTEPVLTIVMLFVVPVSAWLVLGWYFSYLSPEDYKVFCKRLWAIPTVITFLLFISIKLITLILNILDVKVTNFINGRHYLKSNDELTNLAKTCNISTNIILNGLILLKYVVLAGVGWGTFGAVIWFFLIQIQG